MKKYFLLFGSFFFALFWVGSAMAQDDGHGEWSFAAQSGLNYALSTSMQGAFADYEMAIQTGTTPSRYPFEGTRSLALGFGGQFSYRYYKSSYGLYFGTYGLAYGAGSGGRFSAEGRFSMALFSVLAGIEYTTGEPYQHWNFTGRIAVGPTIIATSYRSSRSSFTRFTDNASGARIGIEIGVSQRYHFIRTPIGIEAGITYMNANLIGRSYVPTSSGGSLFGAAPSINDGKNPDDAKDNSRTIDFLALKIGGRYYF